MARPNPAVTLSVRISPEIRNQLEELSDATGRTKSFLAVKAIEDYLAVHVWQVNAIKNAIKKADSKEAKFIEHQKVVNWVDNWGSPEEKDMPE